MNTSVFGAVNLRWKLASAGDGQHGAQLAIWSAATALSRSLLPRLLLVQRGQGTDAGPRFTCPSWSAPVPPPRAAVATARADRGNVAAVMAGASSARVSSLPRRRIVPLTALWNRHQLQPLVLPHPSQT